MDQKEIYRKTEIAFQQALEAAKKSAKILSKKAGHAAKVSKLLVNKLKLEHKIQKNFTELGHRLYDAVQDAPSQETLRQPGMKKLVEQAKRFNEDLAAIEEQLDREMKKTTSF